MSMEYDGDRLDGSDDGRLVMTPDHPLWNAFIECLCGPGMLDCLRPGADCGRYCQDCFTHADEILREMRLNISDSMQYFRDHGAFCDCGIIIKIEHRRRQSLPEIDIDGDGGDNLDLPVTAQQA